MNKDRINNVLGIETSCDETAVAIYNKTDGIISHKIYSQADLHAKYGGVVPELASRDHIRKLLPLIDECLSHANLTKYDLDGLAYTRGPGLIGALLVGAMIAKTLAYSLRIPSLGVHHLEGHLLAPLLDLPDLNDQSKLPKFPFIALLVSGGHTMLIKVAKLGQYELLGETIDDAAGEAFDKTAKLLGLGYPGGADLAKLALQGDKNAAMQYVLPRPMTEKAYKNNLDFSFSGLKTAVLTTWQKSQKTPLEKANIAASFQHAMVDTLLIKCKRALEQTNVNQLVIAGGVSANLELRSKLTNLMQEIKGELYLPRQEYCTDNGAMIAFAGFLRLVKGQQDNNLSFVNNENLVVSRWPLSELMPI